MKIMDDNYDALLMEIGRHLRKGEGICEIHTDGRWNGRGVRTFGVNWAAIGTTVPEETLKRAQELMHAAQVAQWLNDLRLDVQYSEEPTMTTAEFMELRRDLREMIADGKWDELTEMVKEWEVQ